MFPIHYFNVFVGGGLAYPAAKCYVEAIAFGVFQQAFYRIRLYPVVGVDKIYVFACGEAEQSVSGRGYAAMRLRVNAYAAVGIAFCYLQRVVVRTIVKNNYLYVGEGLRQDTVDTPFEVFFDIVNRDEDRYFWRQFIYAVCF